MGLFSTRKRVSALEDALAHAAPPRYALEIWSDTECLSRTPIDNPGTIALGQWPVAAVQIRITRV